MFLFRPTFNWFDLIVISVLMQLHFSGMAKYSDWWFGVILLGGAIISALFQKMRERNNFLGED